MVSENSQPENQNLEEANSLGELGAALERNRFFGALSAFPEHWPKVR